MNAKDIKKLEIIAFIINKTSDFGEWTQDDEVLQNAAFQILDTIKMDGSLICETLIGMGVDKKTASAFVDEPTF